MTTNKRHNTHKTQKYSLTSLVDNNGLATVDAKSAENELTSDVCVFNQASQRTQGATPHLHADAAAAADDDDDDDDASDDEGAEEVDDDDDDDDDSDVGKNVGDDDASGVSVSSLPFVLPSISPPPPPPMPICSACISTAAIAAAAATPSSTMP
jgi:hypothetical protein